MQALRRLAYVPVCKPGRAILINAGTTRSHHYVGCALCHPRPVKTVHVTLPWLLISGGRLELLLPPVTLKPAALQHLSFSAGLFLLSLPHPPGFSAISEVLLSYSDIQPDSWGNKKMML